TGVGEWRRPGRGEGAAGGGSGPSASFAGARPGSVAARGIRRITVPEKRPMASSPEAWRDPAGPRAPRHDIDTLGWDALGRPVSSGPVPPQARGFTRSLPRAHLRGE